MKVSQGDSMAWNSPGSAFELIGGARLHFGLFATAPGQSPHSARVYGGIGLMVEEPTLCLRAFLASQWQKDEAIRPRLREFRDRVRICLPDLPSMHLEEITWIPNHFGLGSGTQLGLSVARLMTHLAGKDLTLQDLCRLSGRGGRSAIGSHGFSRGGFLVDAGHEAARLNNLGQVAAQHSFPENWPIVLCQVSDRPGLSGTREKSVFDTLSLGLSEPMKEPVGEAGDGEMRRDRLCRLALLGVLPALLQGDWQGFGESIGEFNRVAGEPFSAWQGGDHLKGAESWLNFCRQNGVEGVGQSSWGPTLFAIAADMDQANFLVRSWENSGFGSAEKIRITRSRNEGAQVRPILQV